MQTDTGAEPPSIELQHAAPGEYRPTDERLRQWVAVGLAGKDQGVTLRIVPPEEIRALNHRYRERDKVTNVLSFPSDYPPELGLPYLGDIAICAEVVNREAAEQGKQRDDHWAHMVIHGTLHLCGYDHIDTHEAEQMESREIALLATLNIDNPYEIEPSTRVDHD
ncbi:MAG TPA: rRNA maturation RNase YbeY [Gammaproteobacteria bacterium]|nr:rRNA maturation RNase YbeY [Gammaproteobacteria bacterium]